MHENKNIYFSRFLNSPSGNGGDKRTAQLCDILDNTLDYNFTSICNSPFEIPARISNLLNDSSNFFKKKRSQIYKNRYTYSKYQMWSSSFREHLLYMHLQSQLFVEGLAAAPELLLIDDAVFLAPVVRYAKDKKIPLVVFCHNIETLSFEQVERAHQPNLFNYELELLAMSDLVVTISKEETYLLRNFGINPNYLPYFPLKQTAARLEKVRSRRESSTKADFLLLGTVHNLPTMVGMKRVLSTVAGNDLLRDDKLVVAGYGTQQLEGFTDDPGIEIRGEVTDEELDDLMVTTKGCIVYQESGSGALTKISELLTASVPVIINSHAARSHHNLPGIFEFESLESLPVQLAAAKRCSVFEQVLTPPDTTLLKKRILELVS